MNIQDLVCWQTIDIDGSEYVCMTIEEWGGLKENTKCITNGILYCKSPLNRHWLMNIELLPVKIVSSKEVAVIRFSAQLTSRSLVGIAYLCTE